MVNLFKHENVTKCIQNFYFCLVKLFKLDLSIMKINDFLGKFKLYSFNDRLILLEMMFINKIIKDCSMFGASQLKPLNQLNLRIIDMIFI